jgi:hypothetical protein
MLPWRSNVGAPQNVQFTALRAVGRAAIVTAACIMDQSFANHV